MIFGTKKAPLFDCITQASMADIEGLSNKIIKHGNVVFESIKLQYGLCFLEISDSELQLAKQIVADLKKVPWPKVIVQTMMALDEQKSAIENIKAGLKNYPGLLKLILIGTAMAVDKEAKKEE